MASLLHALTAVLPVLVVAAELTLPTVELTALIGVVVPAELALLAAGILTAQHRLSLTVAVAAAVTGALTATAAGFLTGRHHGSRVLDRVPNRVLPARTVARVETVLRRRARGPGGALGGFPFHTRLLTAVLAGMGPVRWWAFLPGGAAGATIWAGTYTALGYLTATATERWLNPDPRLTGPALLTGAVLTVLWRHRHPTPRSHHADPVHLAPRSAAPHARAPHTARAPGRRPLRVGTVPATPRPAPLVTHRAKVDHSKSKGRRSRGMGVEDSR